MNFELQNYIVSPVTKEKLSVKGGKLVDESGNIFKVINNVPILIPEEYMANWHRELIEILLWEYPHEVENIYKEKDWQENPVGVYTRYLKRILKDKNGIINAFERYAEEDTSKWLIPVKSSKITIEQRMDFLKYSKKKIGAKRTETKINPTGIFIAHPYLSELTNQNNPETIVELGMGAGGGTAAVALGMSEKAVLYPVDIGFDNLGNAVGIRKFQNKNIVPVCANFWYLPFAESSIDSVFTNNGLDESRETERTIKEVARILKIGGTFTVSSRKNAYMRQGAVLEQFGFTEKETVEYLKKCRVYSDTEELQRLCEANGLEFVSSKEFLLGSDKIQVVSQFRKGQ